MNSNPPPNHPTTVRNPDENSIENGRASKDNTITSVSNPRQESLERDRSNPSGVGQNGNGYGRNYSGLTGN